MIVDELGFLAFEWQERAGEEMARLFAAWLERKGKVMGGWVDRFSFWQKWPPVEEFGRFVEEHTDLAGYYYLSPRCMVCGEGASRESGRHLVSAVTTNHFWTVNFGDGQLWRVHPVVQGARDWPKAALPYYAPVCSECDRYLRPKLWRRGSPVEEVAYGAIVWGEERRRR